MAVSKPVREKMTVQSEDTAEVQSLGCRHDGGVRQIHGCVTVSPHQFPGAPPFVFQSNVQQSGLAFE